MIETVEYDAYGLATVYAGAQTLTESTKGNPHLFQGRRFDPETGFYYFRNRYLHTYLGRFTTNDPIGSWGDGGNLGNGLAFAGKNPTTGSDPSGLMQVGFQDVKDSGPSPNWGFNNISGESMQLPSGIMTSLGDEASEQAQHDCGCQDKKKQGERQEREKGPGIGDQLASYSRGIGAAIVSAPGSIIDGLAWIASAGFWSPGLGRASAELVGLGDDGSDLYFIGSQITSAGIAAGAGRASGTGLARRSSATRRPRISAEAADLTVRPHKLHPSPRPRKNGVPREGHHDMLGEWLRVNFKRCKHQDAPSFMLCRPKHRLAHSRDQQWINNLPENLRIFDRKKGKWRARWDRIPEDMIMDLAEQQMTLAGLPRNAQIHYFNKLYDYMKAIL